MAESEPANAPRSAGARSLSLAHRPGAAPPSSGPVDRHENVISTGAERRGETSRPATFILFGARSGASSRSSAAGPPRLLRDPVLPERLLAKLWMARAGRRMRTLDGRRLRVVYPGRPAPGHGPDFRDALLELDGKRVRGPVEVHRTPAEWAAHGHSANPAYDGIVLHVVGRAGRAAASAVPSGVPTVELTPDAPTVEIDPDTCGPVPAAPASENGPAAPIAASAAATTAASGPAPRSSATIRARRSPGLPLAGLAALPDDALAGALRRAGAARLRERAERAAEAIDARGLEQALYAAVMDALGYAENRGSFAELARRLPIAVLRAAAMAFPAGPLTPAPSVIPSGAKRSRGTSLPTQRRARLLRDLLASASGLEAPSEAWLRLGGTAPMEREAWRLAGVRPANHPLRRIDAAAALLARTLPRGLGAALSAACLGGPRPVIQELQGSDRGVRGDPSDSPVTLGEGRAREIAVNAVLPLLLAWARRTRNRALARACLDCYRRFPALPDNTITREARRLLGERGTRLRPGACEHQGLMHLYRKAVASER